MRRPQAAPQRPVVDDRAAGGVDQDLRSVQLRQGRLIEQVMAGPAPLHEQRGMQTQHATAEQGGEGLQNHAIELPGSCVQIGVTAAHPPAETARHGGEATTHGPHTHNAQSLAALQIGPGPIQGQQCRQHVFDDGIGIGAGGRRKGDSARAQISAVDVLDPGRGRADKTQG